MLPPEAVSESRSGATVSTTEFPHRDVPTPSGEQFTAIQASPEFAELRRRLRRFVFPMTALFLAWYATYVLLGAFAHDFMAIKVFGNVNVGLLIGLGQFLTTFAFTDLSGRFHNRGLDPGAAAIRSMLEERAQ